MYFFCEISFPNFSQFLNSASLFVFFHGVRFKGKKKETGSYEVLFWRYMLMAMSSNPWLRFSSVMLPTVFIRNFSDFWDDKFSLEYLATIFYVEKNRFWCDPSHNNQCIWIVQQHCVQAPMYVMFAVFLLSMQIMNELTVNYVAIKFKPSNYLATCQKLEWRLINNFLKRTWKVFDFKILNIHLF